MGQVELVPISRTGKLSNSHQTVNLWRDGIGAKLIDRENPAAELSGRNYSDESIGKTLGGNMMRVLRNVLR